MSPGYDAERDADNLWDRVDDAYDQVRERRLDELAERTKEQK